MAEKDARGPERPGPSAEDQSRYEQARAREQQRARAAAEQARAAGSGRARAYHIDDDDDDGPGSWERFQTWFLSGLDISTQLSRTLQAIDDGVPSLGIPPVKFGIDSFIGFVLGCIGCILFGSLAFLLDLYSTYTATKWFSDWGVGVMTPFVAAFPLVALLIRWLPTVITIGPTVIEGFGARFAALRSLPWQVAVWLGIILDAATDIPQVNHHMEGAWVWLLGQYADSWAILYAGPGAWLALAFYYFIWLLVLFGSTFFAELLFTVTLVSTGYLFMRSVLYWVAGLLIGFQWFQRLLRLIAGMRVRFTQST